jgi:FMN-dependent oxidoreductase (nitrilotriacetate monooxygenase family)
MWFGAFSPHAGFGLDGWHGPRTGTGYDWTRPELWRDMAVALERARFDLVMLGDSLAVPATYQGRTDAYLRYAEHAPFHDPAPLMAIMAAATTRIGLALTLSTTFYPPFLLARLLTTLDHLSRGRIAWNVVTSYKLEEAQNFGYRELLDHDQRYDRADEYMELCYRLWDSWEPDAVVMDPRTDTFADPARVHPIDFEGSYYRSRGPLNATPSPQGRPVIVQAGTSERGQDFAARHAEAIIVGRETVDDMKQFYDSFKARLRKLGREPDDCKIFFLVKPIVGDTDEAARQTADQLYANAPVEAGLAALSTLLQIDLSTYDLDQPLPASIQARAIQGIRSQLDRFYLAGRTPTLREIATRKVSLDSTPFIGAPQSVADGLARTIEAIGGDGFAIRQGIWPGYVGPFVEQVVPLLQQRGAARAEYVGTTLREHLREF